MNTAQHAGLILSAWQTSDHSALDDALHGAQQSCHGIPCMNRFESEKQEVLSCVVEHFRTLDLKEAIANGRCMAGATVLLAHLSSGLVKEGPVSSSSSFLATKVKLPN